MSKIFVVALVILTVWIAFLPKELPPVTFNISVMGQTRYYAEMSLSECDRHITTVRQTLLLRYSLIEVQEIFLEKIVEAKCTTKIKLDD